MKLAVIFPGIGYHTDKPLLYYGKKLAASYGYEIVKLSYQHFPEKVKDSKEKMQQSVEIALEQTEEKLKKSNFLNMRIFFLSLKVLEPQSQQHLQKTIGFLLIIFFILQSNHRLLL